MSALRHAGVALAVLIASTGAAHAGGRDRCTADPAVLALPEAKFDQDEAGGWRPLAARTGCERAAADLIARYRALHPATSTTLLWHEGQLRATAGDTAHAVPLLERARHPGETGTGWNEYVDATIAFLRHDRSALEDAARRLHAVPPPSTPILDTAGHPVALPWPPNGDLVDGFLACFDRSYAEAYGTCRRATPQPAGASGT